MNSGEPGAVSVWMGVANVANVEYLTSCMQKLVGFRSRTCTLDGLRRTESRLDDVRINWNSCLHLLRVYWYRMY